MTFSFSKAGMIAGMAVCLTTLAGASAALAQSVVHSPPRATAAAVPLTAAQLADILKIAKPMGKQLAAPPAVVSAQSLPTNRPVGAAPPVVVQGDPGPADQSAAALPVPKAAEGGAVPQNYGAGNLSTVYHYSDSLIDTKLSRTYPQRATGFFLFQQNGGWYYCSGSMISRSIVLVAGHCVHSGNNSASGWNTAGYFYASASGMNGGTPVTPYGVATASQYWTWSTWYSTGALDQGYDVGLVLLNTRDGDARKTWEVGWFTGTYGFCLSNCLQPYWSLTQLGYPSNYYGGNFMTEGNHLYVSDGRDYVFGSGMQGGSSGGPHVANLGSLSDSSSNQGQWPNRNVVFAPTSWGYIDQSIKIQGASSLSGPGNAYLFKNLYNPACTASRALHGAISCTLQ